MFGSKILPAILIMVPAAVLVSTQASLSQPAAEECKISPGPNTPRGAHWYYHVNRAKQRCWYLGVNTHANKAAVTPSDSTSATPQQSDAAEPAAADVAPAAATASAPIATAVAMPAPAAAAPTVAPITPVAAMSTAATAASTLPEPPRGPGFVMRWPDNLPTADNLDQQEPAPVSNRTTEERGSTEQAPQMPPKSSPTDADHSLAAAGGEAVLRYFSIAGAVGIPLLLAAGWVAKFARRPRRLAVRDQWHTIVARLRPQRHVDADPFIGIAPLAAGLHDDTDWQPPTPTDPAYDLKTSLAELMHDLRRAGAFKPVQPSEQPTEQTTDENDYPGLEAADHPTEEPARQPAGQTRNQEFHPVLEAAE